MTIFWKTPLKKTFNYQLIYSLLFILFCKDKNKKLNQSFEREEYFELRTYNNNCQKKLKQKTKPKF